MRWAIPPSPSGPSTATSMTNSSSLGNRTGACVLALQRPFGGAGAGPGAGQLPADAVGLDDLQQSGAVADDVLGDAQVEVVGESGGVLGVPVGPVEVQQVDQADRGEAQAQAVRPQAWADEVAAGAHPVVGGEGQVGEGGVAAADVAAGAA